MVQCQIIPVPGVNHGSLVLVLGLDSIHHARTFCRIWSGYGVDMA